jgi:repressor LexA
MVLTRRQREVMDFIAGFLRERNYSPSFEEIGQGMNLSSLATVHKHISTLERKGFLKRAYNCSRSLEPGPKYLQEARRAKQEKSSMELPLLGRIAAGRPVEAPEQPETISFGDLAGRKDVFVLQVRGDSMIDEHIVDGDYILVEKAAEVPDGELTVVLVGGTESTLKRLYREPGGRIRLQPSNTQMEPILVAAADVAVQGRVIGVLRRY